MQLSIMWNMTWKNKQDLRDLVDDWLKSERFVRQNEYRPVLHFNSLAMRHNSYLIRMLYSVSFSR